MASEAKERTIGELVQEAFVKHLNKLEEALAEKMWESVNAAQQRATAAESRYTGQYKYLIQMMRQVGLETDKTGSLEDYGFDMLVAMFAQSVREANERAVEIESRTSKAMHELAKVHDILDAECKALGVEWQGVNAGTLQAVLAKLREALGTCERQVQPQPRIVEREGKRYRFTGEKRLPKEGEAIWDADNCIVSFAGFDYTFNQHDILEELPPAPSVDEPEGERSTFTGQPYESLAPSPAPPAETGEAGVQIASDWRVHHDDNGDFLLWDQSSTANTREQAESAADWLNRRADIESQLATYKQQAEAWEAVRNLKITVEADQKAFVIRMPERPLIGCFIANDPVEAVLALAAQLESQQPSDGK